MSDYRLIWPGYATKMGINGPYFRQKIGFLGMLPGPLPGAKGGTSVPRDYTGDAPVKMGA